MIQIKYTFDATTRNPASAPASGKLHLGPTLAATATGTMANTVLDGKAIISPTGPLLLMANDSSGNLYKWADPTAPGTFTTTALSLTNISANGLYVPQTGLYYTGPIYSDIGDGARAVNISKVNPTTMAETAFLTNVLIGTTGNDINVNSGLASDGTYLYLVSDSFTENAWLYKFRLSDGATIASIQVPNRSGGAANSFRGIAIVVNNGYVYAAGRSWIVKAPDSLSSVSLLDTTNTLPGNDLILAAGYLWQPNEANGTHRVHRYNLELTTETTVDTGAALANEGSAVHDGVFLWLGTKSGTIIAIRTATPATVATIAIGTAGGQLIKLPNALWYTTTVTPSAPIAHYLSYYTLPEATTLAVSETDFFGANQTAALTALVGSQLRLSATGDPSHWAKFTITSAFVDNTGWGSIGVVGTDASSPQPFADGETILLSTLDVAPRPVVADLAFATR